MIWTPELSERLAVAWNRGDMVRQIVADLNIPKTSILRRRHHMGLPPRARAKWTAQDHETLRIMWERGDLCNVIARALDVTEEAVLKQRTILGLAPRTGFWTEELTAKFRARWDAGDTPQQIATALGVTIPAVYEKRRRLGLPSRVENFVWTPELLERFCAMWAAGDSYQDIANAFGIAVLAARNKREKLGLPVRPRVRNPRKPRVRVRKATTPKPRLGRLSLYSPEQDAIFRRDWLGGVDAAVIMERINALPGVVIKDVERVRDRAANLKLRRPDGWRQFTIRKAIDVRVARTVAPRLAGIGVPLRQLIQIGRQDYGLSVERSMDPDTVTRAAKRIDPNHPGFRLVSAKPQRGVFT